MVTAGLVLLLAFATTTPPGLLPQDTSGLKLDLRIPTASRHKYEHIPDAKDSRNPYLIVLKDGFEVRAGSSRTVVPVSELRGVLVRLPGPIERWDVQSSCGQPTGAGRGASRRQAHAEDI
jgi:hypothetical protein